MQFTPIMEEERAGGQDVHLPVAPEEGSRFGKAHHILLLFAGLALLVWILSGFYKVNPGEVAIVERLGHFVGSVNGRPGTATQIEPGPHYHLPWPIDTVHKVATRQTRNLVVDVFNTSPDAYADMKQQFAARNRNISIVLLNAIFDPYLITADKNIVHMQVAVTYTVDDPEAWLTTASHEGDTAGESEGMREAIFQQQVQHAMVHLVSSLPINNILFEGRERLPDLLKKEVTEALELPDPNDPTGKARISMGVHVDKVDLVEARPPQYVAAAFEQVTQERANMVRTTAQAQADANAVKTQAESARLTMVGSAEAYKKQVVEAAKGEASRFAQVWEQYKQAPDVTLFNLHSDAIRAVAAAANRVMFVQPGQQATLTIDPPQFDAGQVNTKP
jgi:membrane protease subunit HflK